MSRRTPTPRATRTGAAAALTLMAVGGLATALAQVQVTGAPSTDPIQAPINMDHTVRPVQHAAGTAFRGQRLPDDALAGLTWIQGAPVDLAHERGKVVVIQFWSLADTSSRSWQQRVAASQLRFGRDDLTVVAIHPPGDTDAARTFVDRQSMKVATAIDTDGRLTRLFRADLHPYNILLDRRGAIRSWGFNGRGIDIAIEALMKEHFDPTAPLPPVISDSPPKPAPQGPPAAAVPAPLGEDGYPPYSNMVRAAADLRGKPAPPLRVQTWLTDQPDLTGKVLIIDFWATWCGPCIASIPHTNDLANRFRDSVVVVGLSREDTGTVRQFLRRAGMEYAIAVDPMGRTQIAANVIGIPHMMVVSPDGIVRFQGMPVELTPEILGHIITASNPAN